MNMLDELKHAVGRAQLGVENSVHEQALETFLATYGPALIAALELAESCKAGLRGGEDDKTFCLADFLAYRAAKETG
jgi:hypothetical protein